MLCVDALLFVKLLKCLDGVFIVARDSADFAIGKTNRFHSVVPKERSKSACCAGTLVTATPQPARKVEPEDNLAGGTGVARF